MSQVNNFISNAAFNGRNLLSAASVNINSIANIDGSTLVIRNGSSIQAQAVTLGVQSISTTATAQTALSFISAFQQSVNNVLGTLGADTRSLDFQDNFVQAISDATEVGLGAIVDADLARNRHSYRHSRCSSSWGLRRLTSPISVPQCCCPSFR